jgi:hypothetical protein
MKNSIKKENISFEIKYFLVKDPTMIADYFTKHLAGSKLIIFRRIIRTAGVGKK